MKFLVALCCVLLTFVTAENSDAKAPSLSGPCPDIKAAASFDPQKLAGDWFVVYAGVSGLQERPGGKCLTKTITPKSGGSHEASSTVTAGDKKKTATYTANAVAGSPGKFTLSAGEESKFTRTMSIIDTDNTDYHVSVICKSDGKNHGLMATVYSRAKTLGADDVSAAKAAVKAQNINIELKPIELTC